MDIHELTKMESRRNVTLVLTLAGLFILLFGWLHFSTPGSSLNNIELGIGGVVLVFTIICGALAAYYGTVAGRYNTLYSGSLDISSNTRSLLNALTRDKIPVPVKFLNLNGNYEQVYKESLLTYLQSFPNASLPVTLKCLEVALKEKYITLKAVAAQTLSLEDQEFINKVDRQIQHATRRKKNPDIDDVDLFNLIECAQVYFKNHKDILQYLRDVRNCIHTRQVVPPTDAQLAISKTGSGLNTLFPLPLTLNLSIKCKVCAGTHQYNINSSEYFIGNVLHLECKNPNIEDRAYSITVPLYLWQ